MDAVKVVIVGAGSRSFGPGTVRDLMLSDPLAERGLSLVLMDKVADALVESERVAQQLRDRCGRTAAITSTTDLDTALAGADFVITAIEVDRYLYWSQDFHVPRSYGFRQVYGENGGPGGIFHALRNMGPMVEIARTMERVCPDGVLLNFTNPEHKICEALTRLTAIRNVGLCHGVFDGLRQLSHLLDIPIEQLDAGACGMNHFTFFQWVRDRRTGEDLYPRLREIEREGDWLADWHEIALGRVLFRRFGLWPSPAANHYGEYIRWAEEFVASELQYFYDPADGHPWETGVVPEFVYSLSGDKTTRPWRRPEPPEPVDEDVELKPSGELAVPIMEGLACGVAKGLDAINVPNKGAIPNLPDDMVVEVPATVGDDGLSPCRMEPLPEAIAAMLRLHGTIHKLLVEAFAERSKDKLIQTMLLEPTVDSYRHAIELVDEMLRLQRDLLPQFG